MTAHLTWDDAVILLLQDLGRLPRYPTPWVRCVKCEKPVAYHSDEHLRSMVSVDRPPFSFAWEHRTACA